MMLESVHDYQDNVMVDQSQKENEGFRYRECISMLPWRTAQSPQVTRTIHTDCLLNYETVKYFNGETHEGERYAKALKDYQAEAYKYYREYPNSDPGPNEGRTFSNRLWV